MQQCFVQHGRRQASLRCPHTPSQNEFLKIVAARQEEIDNMKERLSISIIAYLDLNYIALIMRSWSSTAALRTVPFWWHFSTGAVRKMAYPLQWVQLQRLRPAEFADFRILDRAKNLVKLGLLTTALGSWFMNKRARKVEALSSCRLLKIITQT